MRKILASVAIGSIAVGATLALPSASARAATLLVQWTESSAGIDVSWEQSSNPTPADYASGGSTVVPVWDFTSTGSTQVGPGSYIVWYNIAHNGLFSTVGEEFGLYGDQAYTGDESAPVFTTGTYQGKDTITGPWVATVTISLIPEPSTWAMMLLGFGGLGFAGYRASRKSAALAV